MEMKIGAKIKCFVLGIGWRLNSLNNASVKADFKNNPNWVPASLSSVDATNHPCQEKGGIVAEC